jgi:hypothetical protein
MTARNDNLNVSIADATDVLSVNDADLTIRDNADTTKAFNFQVSGVTTATTRTLTIPNESGTLALADDLSAVDPTLAPYLLTVDGTTDNTAGLQAVIDAVYAAKGTRGRILIRDGTTYRIDEVNLKCSLVGGGTIKTRNTLSTQASVGKCLTVPNGYDDVSIEGITIDGNLAGATPATYSGTIGVRIQSDNVQLRGVTVQNTLHAGVSVAYTDAALLTGVVIQNCRITTARSNDDVVTPVYGDGVTSEWTDGLIVEGCSISDCTRVGITIEGTSALKARNARILNNRIENMHDAASPEENSGIWCENTLSAVIIGNTCVDTGRGITIAPLSVTTEARFDIIGNHIIDNVKAAYVLTGAAQNASVSIRGGSVKGTVLDASAASQVINITGLGGEIDIDGVKFGAVTSTNPTVAGFPNNSSAGLIFVAVSANTYPLKKLTIRNCTKEAQTYAHNDSGDINVLNAGTTKLELIQVLDNPDDWSMVMQAAAAEARARNTILTHSAGSGAILNATLVSCEYPQIQRTASSTPITGTSHDYIIIDTVAGVSELSLPASQPRGRQYVIAKTTANNLTITPASANIDGAATKVINNTQIRVVFDGSQWRTIGS